MQRLNGTCGGFWFVFQGFAGASAANAGRLRTEWSECGAALPNWVIYGFADDAQVAIGFFLVTRSYLGLFLFFFFSFFYPVLL
jgi:hypothetical protein